MRGNNQLCYRCRQRQVALAGELCEECEANVAADREYREYEGRATYLDIEEDENDD